MFKVNNKDTRTTPGIFIVNFQHIFTPCSSVPIAKFEHEIAGWENTCTKEAISLFLSRST